MAGPLALDLRELCDDEVRLQSWGALLAVHGASQRIHYASAGAFEFLGLGSATSLGADADGVCLSRVCPEARAVLRGEDFSDWRALVLTTTRGKPFQCSVHASSNGYQILEFEEYYPEPPPQLTDHVNEACERILCVDEEGELLRQMIEEVAAVSAFGDRVLVYHVPPTDGGSHGRVLAEHVRHPSWPAYQGLSLLSSDVPITPTRHRFLAVSAAQNALIKVAENATAWPDLSQALLVGHTASQRQYYEAMGVKSVLVYCVELPGQGNWGYLALHSATADYVPVDVRNALLPLVRTFSGTLKSIKARQRLADEAHARELQLRVFSRLQGQSGFLTGVLDGSPSLKDAIPCGSCAVLLNDEVVCTAGSPPPGPFVARVAKLLRASANPLEGVWLAGSLDAGRLWVTNRIAEYLSDAPSYSAFAAGALLVQVSWRMQVYIMWMRPAAEQEVNWAGMPPGSAVSVSAPSPRDSARGPSFERWREVVKDRCEPWDEQNFNVAQAVGRTMDEALRLNKMISSSTQRLNMLAQQMHQIIANVPVVVFRVDKEYRIREWNPTAEAMLGWERQEAIGRVAMELLAPEQYDVADMLSSILMRALDGVQTRDFEISLQPRPDVPHRMFLLTTGAEVTREGSIEGIMVVCQDVSALKEITAERSASSAKSSFIASMSKELRAPLNGIMGMLALASDTDLPPDVRDYVSKASDCSEYLQDLISNILDVTLVEARRLVVKKDPFDLREAIEGAITIASAKSAARGGQVRLDAKDPLPERPCVGDVGRLKQILVNLITNAMKYSSPGTPVEVEVRVAASTAASATVQVAVVDHGIGIKPESQAQLFQLFKRIRDGQGEDPGGCGIGLWLSRDLAQLMGGLLECRSAYGQGSTFTLTLPLPLYTGARAASSSLPLQLRGASPAGAGGAVLLVEPSRTDATVSATFLERAGHAVHHVATGEEALAAYESRPFDLVIMDTELPRMSGYDTARRVRALEREGRRPAVPIVAVSARVLREDELRCYDAGMNEHLPKPLQFDRLVATVGHFLHTRQARP